MAELKCTVCGGECVKADMICGHYSNLSVDVKTVLGTERRSVSVYLCRKCGKIELYADIENKKK